MIISYFNSWFTVLSFKQVFPGTSSYVIFLWFQYYLAKKCKSVSVWEIFSTKQGSCGLVTPWIMDWCGMSWASASIWDLRVTGHFQCSIILLRCTHVYLSGMCGHWAKQGSHSQWLFVFLLISDFVFLALCGYFYAFAKIWREPYSTV